MGPKQYLPPSDGSHLTAGKAVPSERLTDYQHSEFTIIKVGDAQLLERTSIKSD
jgi:hypothetical protein